MSLCYPCVTVTEESGDSTNTLARLPHLTRAAADAFMDNRKTPNLNTLKPY